VRELACTRGRGTTWDGRDSRGQAAPPGIYFSRLEGAGLVPGVKLIKLE
jgi:hypothetical protein